MSRTQAIMYVPLSMESGVRTPEMAENLKYFNTLCSCLFLPRCMECRRGRTMRFMSVRPYVKRVHCDKTEENYV